MAHVSSLKSAWETADNSYIQAMKSGRRVPVSRRLFPENKYESNRTGKELQRSRNGSECDDVSEDGFNHETFGNFDAIPEEFRPSKRGKDLLKVMTSPKKDDSKEEPRKNERYQTTPSESQRKRSPKNSNSSTVQNETRNYKMDSLETEDSDQSQQKELGVMFFYNGSSGNGSTEKAARGSEQNYSGREKSRIESSEKPKLKNMHDERSQSKFFNSNSSQSKATNKLDTHSSFAQNKDEIKFQKYNKNSFSNFQDPTASSQNKASFEEKGHKITRETTVTKRIQWKSELCKLKKPENKPNIFCEYTKTTKHSVSYVSSHDKENDEATERPNQDFKKERRFRNDFRRMCSVHDNNEPRQFEYRKDKGFNFTNKFQRKENQFVPGGPQKLAKTFEENQNCSQCCKGKNTVIVKVVHINGSRKNNRKFHKSFQTNQPLNKDGNGRIINTGDRHHCDKTGKNTMAKTAEDFQEKREKDYERPPSKLTNSSTKNEYAHDAFSINNNSNESASVLFECGREISELIVGSSMAITIFLDNYEQWKDLRRVTMLLFEEFEKNLSQSCNKNKRIIEVVEMVGAGCKMAQYVPHVGVSVAAKVIACLSDIVTKMFSSSKSAKSIGLDDFQLRLCLQRDMEATSDIYLHGLQCDLQFQETCQNIEEFHTKIKDGCFGKFLETFETGFLKEISLLNPKHPEVFYKRLERFYQLLNDRQQSEEGEAFCRAFEDWPDALAAVSRLPRRFKTENWDSSPVLKTWEEIYNLLQNDQSAVEAVLKKIQDCICVLIREQSVIEKYVMDLKRRT